MTDRHSSKPISTSTSSSGLSVTRRDFITLAWKGLMALSGALGLAGLVRFFSYQTNPSKPVLFDLGPVDKVATDAITLVPNAQSAILPVEGGFQALSLVCPHLGCLVDAKKDRFVCPCHGSEFNLDGSLKKGPSDRALTSLPLEITEEGHLLLDTSES